MRDIDTATRGELSHGLRNTTETRSKYGGSKSCRTHARSTMRRSNCVSWSTYISNGLSTGVPNIS